LVGWRSGRSRLRSRSRILTMTCRSPFVVMVWIGMSRVPNAGRGSIKEAVIGRAACREPLSIRYRNRVYPWRSSCVPCQLTSKQLARLAGATGR
jgi:hypothetical protein